MVTEALRNLTDSELKREASLRMFFGERIARRYERRFSFSLAVNFRARGMRDPIVKRCAMKQTTEAQCCCDERARVWRNARAEW
jgi:hypothetical protein